MSSDRDLGYVEESQKEVPVAYDVDVAVVGAGLSGLFAALAAGRRGAKTLVIDRFGALGGNLGPAMIVGGSVYGEAVATLPGGIVGIPKELVTRMDRLKRSLRHDYAEETNIISYLGVKMAEEAGVELLLSVWAADPIVEDDRVTGLFVEGKSGRVAVKAKVVIDASGDADIARRAGVPVVTDLPPDPSWAPVINPRFLYPEYEVWNDTGILYMVANVDGEAYRGFLRSKVTLGDADRAWLDERNKFVREGMAYRGLRLPDVFVPLLREAWEKGDYQYQKTVEPKVHVSLNHLGPPTDGGLTGSRVNMGGEIRRDDMKQHSRLESAIRVHVFDTVQFFHKYVPGFEGAYLLFIAPYFGARGGPYIEGEYVITPQDTFTGERFDDVLFRNTHNARMEHGGAEKSGYDTPYRSMLPKGMDGLLVTGRASSYVRRGHDPGSTRARGALMLLGQAAGTAAAMSIKDGVSPRKLDVKKLQRELLKEGFNMGEEARLAELGLR